MRSSERVAGEKQIIMNTDRRNTQSEDAEESLGVLDSTGTISTADLGLLGDATAQVPVALPVADEDDLVDDDVTDGEAFTDLVLEADPAAFVPDDDGIGRIHEGPGIADIVIEIPAAAAEETVVAELVENEGDDEDAARTDASVDGADEHAEPVEPGTVDEREPVGEQEPVAEPEQPAVEQESLDEREPAREPQPVVESGPEHEGEREAVVEREPAAAQEPADEAASDGRLEIEDDEADADLIADDAEPARDESIDAAPRYAEVTVAATASRGAADAPREDIVLRAVEPHPVPASAAHIASVVPLEEETMTDDHVRAPEPELASRRLDQLADRERESADLLTADRLLDASRLTAPEPEGLWSHLLYTISGRRINLGDGKRAQQRKALSARIAAPLPGSARFVPVLSRKGGVGKTTVTALLGMALADAREDRVIAVDANPDRGTLADRIARTNSKTVRDLVRIHDQVTGYHDISAVVSRDATRLDVLASDTDPRVSEAFNDEDYDQVASVAAHYYSLVLTDTGTGIVHAVMGATLDRADTLVVVAGLSVDEARLASETLTWLETNGYADKVREAVVVLNQSTPGAPMVRLSELEAHFRTRVAHVLRIPYDVSIAAGSAISFSALQPETRQAARELAAVVVEGLRAQAA